MNVLLLSGGLESVALCYLSRPDLCITVDYGQPAFAGEKRASSFFCKSLDINHMIVRGTGYQKRVGETESWWPFRNQLLLTLAATATSHLDVKQIAIGLVRSDIYTDCTRKFVDAAQALFAAQDSNIQICAPALELSTMELLRKAYFPADSLNVTFSCHRMPYPCGACPGCRKSREVKELYFQSSRSRANAACAASR